MIGPISVGLALSGREWRSALQRYCRDYVADVSVQLVRDGSQALAGSSSVLILDDDTSWLSVPLLAAARERGVAVIGLYDPLEADGHGQRHLARLGVDAVLSAALPTEELLEVIRKLAPDVETFDRFMDAVEGIDNRVPPTRRKLIAIGGPAGSGATEIAIAFAQTMPGRPPILIDVDETHPSVARRLGLAIHPHIVTAIEALRHERVGLAGSEADSLSDCLARPALSGPVGFDTIVGLASRDDWTLLRSDDVTELVEELAARWPAAVVRVGPQLEDLTRWVDRYEVSRRVLARSNRVIGVCQATSLGVLRFVDWLVDAVAVVDQTPIDVVLNFAPKSLSARAQLVNQLREIAGDRIGQILMVPADKRVERASWDANLVARGPFIRAVAKLHPIQTPRSIKAGDPAAAVGQETSV